VITVIKKKTAFFLEQPISSQNPKYPFRRDILPGATYFSLKAIFPEYHSSFLKAIFLEPLTFLPEAFFSDLALPSESDLSGPTIPLS